MYSRPDSDTFTDEVFDARSTAASSGGTFSIHSGARTGTFSESGIYFSSSRFDGSSDQLKNARHYREHLWNNLRDGVLQHDQYGAQAGEFIKTAYIGNIPYYSGKDEVRCGVNA